MFLRLCGAFYDPEKKLMHPDVVSELWMKGCGQDASLPYDHRLPVAETPQDLNAVPNRVDSRRPDKDSPEWRSLYLVDQDILLEAVHLAAEGVAAYLDIHQAQGHGAPVL